MSFSFDNTKLELANKFRNDVLPAPVWPNNNIVLEVLVVLLVLFGLLDLVLFDLLDGLTFLQYPALSFPLKLF